MEKERQEQQSNPLIQHTVTDYGGAVAPSHHLQSTAFQIPGQLQLQHHGPNTTLEHHMGSVFTMHPNQNIELWPSQDPLKTDLDDKLRKRKLYCSHCGHELDLEQIEGILNDLEKPRKKVKIANSHQVTLINSSGTPSNTMGITSTATTATTIVTPTGVSGTNTSINGEFMSEKKKQKNQRAEQKDIITTFARIIMTESDASYSKQPLPKDAVYGLYEKHVKSHPIPYHVFWRYVLGKSDNKKQKPLWGVNVQSSRKGGTRGILGVRFRNIDDLNEKAIMEMNLEILSEHGVPIDANLLGDDLRIQYESYRPKTIPQYHHQHTKVESQAQPQQQQAQLNSQNPAQMMDIDKVGQGTDPMISSPEKLPFLHLNSKLLKIRMKGFDLFRRVILTKFTMKELVEKIMMKFAILESSAIREIRELPNVILVDDSDVSALNSNAELEVTVIAPPLQ